MDPHRTSGPTPGPRPAPRDRTAEALERVAEADRLLESLDGGAEASELRGDVEVFDAVHRALQDAMTLAEH